MEDPIVTVVTTPPQSWVERLTSFLKPLFGIKRKSPIISAVTFNKEKNMANQVVVDAIVKVLTDNGYTAPTDTSQLSGQVDTFITDSGFVQAPQEDAQDQQVDADKAQVATDEAKLADDEAADEAEDASATPEVEAGN